MQWTKKEKGRRRNSRFKVGIEAYGDNFWDSEGTRGSRTEATWKLSRAVLFLQDNASVHTARVSRQALKDTGFSEIDHPPYSPDLAPSDYFLFSNLKKELRGRRFVDDNQMKMAVESHFDCKEKEYFLGGLKALYTRCRGLISRPSYTLYRNSTIIPQSPPDPSLITQYTPSHNLTIIPQFPPDPSPQTQYTTSHNSTIIPQSPPDPSLRT
ncbi:Mariner Mos1 transposase [Eumeta japonica]|uniref:Mariner Mos1 transposase n=1 Tax=Eumeta variegata TaxID=151549 RepID=A0A4C1VRF5_EUMVA|nr:Mariner Mos1 transposase [Eumeta japonica]